jgi:hypothetical protein
MKSYFRVIWVHKIILIFLSLFCLNIPLIMRKSCSHEQWVISSLSPLVSVDSVAFSYDEWQSLFISPQPSMNNWYKTKKMVNKHKGVIQCARILKILIPILLHFNAACTVSRIQITFNAKYWREREDLCQSILNIKTRNKNIFFAKEISFKYILIVSNDSFLFKILVEKVFAASELWWCEGIVWLPWNIEK